jgi:hypothetical protein
MDQKDYRPILSSNYLPFQIRADVIKWLIGNVCWHKPCLQCNEEELSRKHGISCSGAELEMQVIFDTEFTKFYENTLPTDKWCLLDHILTKARNFDHPSLYHLVSRWVTL